MRIIQPIVGSFERWASKVPWLTHAYAKPYRDVVQKELWLAGVTKQHTELNIGCGAVPFTAIHTVLLTGASVVAVDCDERAVALARHCVQQLGLAQQIKVLCGSGESLENVQFDSALVALQAEPKQAILERLANLSSVSVPVVFRQPSPEFVGHYDALDTRNLPHTTTAQSMKTFDCSVLVWTGDAYEQSA